MCKTMRKSPTKYSDEFKLSVLREYYSSGMSKRVLREYYSSGMSKRKCSKTRPTP